MDIDGKVILTIVLEETECGMVSCSSCLCPVGGNAVLNSIMNLQFPLKTGNFLIIRATVSFPKTILLQAIDYIKLTTFLYALSTCPYAIYRILTIILPHPH